jgi:hypothetical protein
MKATTLSIIVVFAVSLGIWTAYSFTPYPLDTTDTLVVVAAVGVAVAGAQWLMTKMRKKSTNDEKHD